MAKLPLPFKGTSTDLSGLTATRKRVKQGKFFYGFNSDDIQSGEMPVCPAEKKNLPVNTSVRIAAGYHTGEDEYSNTTPTINGQTVTPGSGMEIIECSNKYMLGDVTVLAVANLRPEVIKYGVEIGEGDGKIKGTWQGFVD